MGQIWAKIFKKEAIRILFLGLDATGKTTLLYQLKLGEVVTTIPTIGFNVETVKHGDATLTAWDVGGRDKIRALWKHYYTNTHAVIYVVDSTDHERLNEAAELFQDILKEDDLREAAFLVLANKQDRENSMSVERIEKALKVQEISKKRRIAIFPTVALDMTGVNEALTWLVNAVASIKAKEAIYEPISTTIVKDKEQMYNVCSYSYDVLWKVWKAIVG